MVSLRSVTGLTAVLVSLLFTSVQAHMKIATPTPFSNDTLDNSPLAGDGSDYPCKVKAGGYQYKIAGEDFITRMAIGVPQTLSFIGGATHGGGACQISLTPDLEPNKQSEWKVIHSIVGGCPSPNEGNVGNDAGARLPNSFQYSIPEGFEPGRYTLAWTWFNRVGNREMYMNCAPIEIEGGAGKKRDELSEKRQAKFPPMMVANIAGVSNGCSTTEGTDPQFPDPGDSLETGSSAKPAPFVGCSGSSAPSTGGQQSPAPGGSGTGSGSNPSPPASAAPSVTSAAPGVFATGASIGGAPPSSPPAPVSPEPAAPAPGSGSPSSAPSAPATGSQSGSCSDDGAWSCSPDGSSFQRCASGAWSAAITMAAGTNCTPGVGANLNIVAAGIAQRGARFARSHIHKRRMHSGGSL